MKYFIKTFILVLCLSLPVVGCGIKPNSVDTPEGIENDTFPRSYPSK